MKNTRSKIKPIKTRNKIRTTYCLGCKDYVNNFKPQEIKMTNKVLGEKSNFFVYWSSKSKFLKQKHSNKKQFQRQHKLSSSFHKLQNMHIYCKSCKKHTCNTFQKKLVLFSKNKIKGKSKCAIWLKGFYSWNWRKIWSRK